MNSPAKRAVALLLTLFIVVTLPSGAVAWDGSGHRIIVRVAMTRLSKDVRQQIRGILGEESVFDAVMWPDSARFIHPYKTTYNNHFVNIPYEELRYLSSRDCVRVKAKGKGDCVIYAIDRYSLVLLKPNSSPEARRDALSFLLHFVGDLHQPLHCTSKDDYAGGSGRKICVGDKCHEDLEQTQEMNLHAAWDSYIIDSAGLSESQYVNKLNNKIAALSASYVAAIESGTTVDWAEESHAVAVGHAYVINDLNADGFYHLPGTYYTDNLPHVDLQLMRAGIRLAFVLNKILAQRHWEPQPDFKASLKRRKKSEAVLTIRRPKPTRKRGR